MTHMQKLQILAKNRFIFTIECFTETGFDWMFGEQTKGFRNDGRSSTAEGAIDDIWKHAVARRPEIVPAGSPAPCETI